MQIKVNLQIFLFIAIFILTHQIEIYACIMIFSLIHELGHMLAGLLLRLKPKTLNFMPFGIRLTFETYEYSNLVERKKFFIAIAGPLTNLIICIIASLLHINCGMKEIIIYSNLLITLFNLIPLYPLDGGRILKCIIKLKYKGMKAETIVNKISNSLIILLTAVSSIAILYFKNLAILFILIYLWVINLNENKKYKIKLRMYNIMGKNNKCIDN